MAKGLFSFFSELKENKEKRKKNERRMRAIALANELFQVREYQDAIWFTYDGELICPCAMFKDSLFLPGALLQQMRNLYVERYVNDTTKSE
jgi:hypothetical protein